MNAWALTIPFIQSASACEKAQKTKPKEFWKIANASWDLVLVDTLFTPCGYAMALRNQKPYINMHSSDLEPWLSYLNGYARSCVIANVKLAPSVSVKEFSTVQ